MPKAVWNGVVLAESEKTQVVEGNHYFPPESVNMQYFQKTNLHTFCPWKGQASYYTVKANGETAENVAWFYPIPKDAAKAIRDHVAFYGLVHIEL